jgi:hypothetical protein
MTIANATEDAILKLVFQAVAWTNYAINHSTTPQTNVGMSLHSADPTDTGDATTSEIVYTGYTRVNVARTTGGWTAVATGTVSPVSNIDFPLGTAGTGGTASFFAAAASNAATPTGAQAILWSGTVVPNIVTGNGVTPRLTTASTITLD